MNKQDDAQAALEQALRYLLKVGYNHGRTQFSAGHEYDDDFGINFDLKTLRSPEREIIIAALEAMALDDENFNNDFKNLPDERIKELMSKTAYPNSISIAQAIRQVLNEQFHLNKQLQNPVRKALGGGEGE